MFGWMKLFAAQKVLIDSQVTLINSYKKQLEILEKIKKMDEMEILRLKDTVEGLHG